MRVRVAVCDTVAVFDCVDDKVIDTVAVGETVSEGVPEALAELLTDAVLLGVAVGLPLALGEEDGDWACERGDNERNAQCGAPGHLSVGRAARRGIPRCGATHIRHDTTVRNYLTRAVNLAYSAASPRAERPPHSQDAGKNSQTPQKWR